LISQNLIWNYRNWWHISFRYSCKYVHF